MQKGALQTGLDLEAEKGRGALKSPPRVLHPWRGAGMRSEKDSTLVMKGLLAIYQLWSEREYSCKRLHRGSV